MTTGDRVTVRIPEDIMVLLHKLLDSGEFSNVSDIVRLALDDFLSVRFSPDNIEKITVEFPKMRVVDLESLVENGDSISLDDAIRNAVREYTDLRVKRSV